MSSESPQKLTHLRQQLARYCAANDNTNPLKKIMMVGAFNNAASVPTGYDKLYLEQTLKELQDRSIPVSREFNIDIVNIAKIHGGRDFLKETAPADLVILCFIFNPASERDRLLTEFTGSKTVSTEHLKPHVWHDAAVRVGAKCISVLGDSWSETGPDFFLTRGKESQYVNLGQSRKAAPHILVRTSGFSLDK